MVRMRKCSSSRRRLPHAASSLGVAGSQKPIVRWRSSIKFRIAALFDGCALNDCNSEASPHHFPSNLDPSCLTYSRETNALRRKSILEQRDGHETIKVQRRGHRWHPEGACSGGVDPLDATPEREQPLQSIGPYTVRLIGRPTRAVSLFPDACKRKGRKADYRRCV